MGKAFISATGRKLLDNKKVADRAARVLIQYSDKINEGKTVVFDVDGKQIKLSKSKTSEKLSRMIEELS